MGTQHTNVATAVGTPTEGLLPGDPPTVEDTNPANYFGVFDENLCYAPGAYTTEHELVDPDYLTVPGIEPGLISEVTIPLGLEGGFYEMLWVSFDTHSSDPFQPLQTNEQWIVQLLDANGGVLYESPPTDDIGDFDDYALGNFAPFGFEGEAVSMRIAHVDPAGNNPNSVTTACVYSNPIDAPGI